MTFATNLAQLFVFGTLLCITLVNSTNSSLNSKSPVNDSIPINNKELIFAHVIFRHGERNILSAYPNSYYKNEQFWPGGFGALTNPGKQSQYELGKYLRTKYQNLIGPKYSPNQVYVRSTDEDRNLMSAECTMAGLFPPISKEEIWNSNLNWQPIPIHAIKLDDDYLLNSFVKCPRFDQLFERRLNDPEVTYLMEKHRPLIDFMAQNSGMPLRRVDDVWKLYGGLVIEQRNKLFTDWVMDALKSNKTLEHIAAVSYASATHFIEQKKQRAGFLIREILNRFTNKTLSRLNPNRSLWIYAIHSTGMVNILNSLNLFDQLHVPPPTSQIFFELYKINFEYHVEIIYRKTASMDEPPLYIPNCGQSCPLTKFYELYKEILPTDDETFEHTCSH